MLWLCMEVYFEVQGLCNVWIATVKHLPENKRDWQIGTSKCIRGCPGYEVKFIHCFIDICKVHQSSPLTSSVLFFVSWLCPWVRTWTHPLLWGGGVKVKLQLLAKIPVKSLMEGVASQNVRFRPCVACRVCNMYKLSCNYIWYYTNKISWWILWDDATTNTGISTIKLPENVGTGW